MFGDVSRPALVDKLKLGQASALILTMDEPVLSVRLVRKVRGWCPDLTIVARARDSRHAAELYRAGATDAVPETLESSLQLSEAVLVDLGIAMGPRSEEHTSELHSLMRISYAVFCLKK